MSYSLENLRDQWNDAVIERVKSSLQKLLPPMENNAFQLFFFLKDTYYVLKDTLLLREFYYFAVIKNPYLIIYKP